MRRLFVCRWVTCSVVCWLSAHEVQAELEPFTDSRFTPWYLDTSDAPRWSVDLGLEAGFEPDYIGSDDYEFEAFPYLVLTYRVNDQLRLRLTPETLGVAWDVAPRTLVQLVIENEEGRESSESEDLAQLPDGRDTVEAELTVARRLGSGSFLYATYQPEIQDRDKGTVWFIGAGHQFTLRPNVLASLFADVSWGDAEHMRTEFGVGPAAAATLAVAEYRPSGGLKSSTLGAGVEWHFSERLSLLSRVEVEYYFDEAAASPLLRDLGSRTGFEVEAAVIYRF